jgi:diguanylate cyclase (GGDEF)-like protein
MNKPELTIERNALASLVLTLSLLGVIIWMNVMGVVRMSNNSVAIARCNDILETVRLFKEHLIDLETGERGYIITGNAAFLEPHENALKEMEGYRNRLEKLLADDPSEQPGLTELNGRYKAKVAISQMNVSARWASFEKARALVAAGNGKREMDALRNVLDGMTLRHIERRDKLRLERDEMLVRMKNNVIIAAVVFVMILLPLHWFLLRGMRLRRAAEQHARHLATHDTLTGLPNRRLILEHLDHAIQRGARNKKGLALLFLDLNGFKPINDKHGHEAGDMVLKLVAQRLSGLVRASDRVARLGGDEFVVLLDEINDKEDVCGIVGKINNEIGRPILLKGRGEVAVSTSIGVAIYPRDGEDMETLLSNADTAMYESKRTGLNCYCKEQKQLRRCMLKDDGK